MFKHKEYVLSICETGSFTKSANKLFISQPSLSATIKKIEDKLGSPIFDRSTTPIFLTDVGQEYVSYAKKIIELENSFEEYISDRGSSVKGLIRIGGSSFFASYFLPNLISNFRAQYKGVEFKIYEDSTKNLIDNLKDSNLDIVIDNANIKDDSILSTPYLKERLFIAVPKKYKINESLNKFRTTSEQIKKGEIIKGINSELKEFEDYPFILLRRNNDTGKRAEKILNKYGVKANTCYLLDQQMTAYNLAITGVGFTFVGEELIKRIENSSELYFYLIDDEYAEREIYFYYKNKQYQTRACKKFIEQNVNKK